MGALLLLRGNSFQRSQRVLDALHCTDGILRVEMRGIGARGPNEYLRQPFILRIKSRGQFTFAQDLEPAERTAYLHGGVVTPGEHGIREGLSGLDRKSTRLNSSHRC